MSSKRLSRATRAYLKVAALFAVLLAAGAANWPKH